MSGSGKGGIDRRGFRLASFTLMLAIPFGCVSIPTTVHTPLLEREVRVQGSDEKLADALVLVFYDFEITPIDYGGPYPLRVGIAEQRGADCWVARDEPYAFTSRLYLWIFVTSWQNRPVFYAILPDGRHGFLSAPRGWAVGLLQKIGGGTARLESARDTDQTADSVDRLLRAILLRGLMWAEPRDQKPNRPLIKPETAVQIARYIEHHPSLFSERTSQLARRLVSIATEPPTPEDLTAWSDEYYAID